MKKVLRRYPHTIGFFGFTLVYFLVMLHGVSGDAQGPLVTGEGKKIVDRMGGKQPTPAKTFVAEPVIVDLPQGQKFVSIIPAIAAGVKFNSRDPQLNIYVTTDRPANEAPRRITFYRPGYSPHNWEAILYIQEH